MDFVASLVLEFCEAGSIFKSLFAPRQGLEIFEAVEAFDLSYRVLVEV